MEKGDPPSPAPSNQRNGNHKDQTDDAILQNGFQQLIQHNNAPATPTPISARTPTPSTSYPEQQQQHRHQQPHDDEYHYHHHQQQQQSHQYPVDIHSYMGSDQHSRYSSPSLQQRITVPVLADEDEFDTSPYPPPHPHSYPGAGMYQQGGYSIDPSPYPQLPDIGSSTTPHNAYSTPATSPPTSLQNDPMTTRSGRAVTRSYGESALGPQSSRVAKSTSQTKKRKRAEGQGRGGRNGKGAGSMATKDVELDAPLSVLCKDMEVPDVPDVDIDQYVRRSPEQRRTEVAQSKDQKIKRPMNAFMLYRKAYQNRTKALRKQHNHQFISQVCGVGWNMEPQELRDRFDELAKIERENHRLAFPDYKFSPTKNPPKKPNEEDVAAANARQAVDDGPVLDDYKYDSPPPSRNESRGTRSSSLFGDPDGEYRPPRAAAAAAYAQFPQHHHQQQHPASRIPSYGAAAYQSSFQYSNPGKPRPAEYGANLGQNQFYQQNSDFTRQNYPHHMSPYASGLNHVPAFVENVYVHKTNSPAGGTASSPFNHHPYQHHGSPVDPYGNMMGSAYPPPPHSTHHHPQHHHSQHIHHAQSSMPHAAHPQHLQHHHHTPTPPPHGLGDHPIDPSLMPQSGGVGAGGHDPYDDLGILGLDQGGEFADGMASYPLDHDLVDHQQQQSHQQQSQSHSQSQQQQASSSETAAATSGETQWQDDPAAAAAVADETKLGREWEMLGESGEFQLEDIDQILGTTNSPG
ncbi:hypothetical protein F5X99DRAFT_407307 [Biscogniauxia marginata]|nr:hypothetical protein F5X99DRAFT_407307 [Biscogniauxia marginata]